MIIKKISLISIRLWLIMALVISYAHYAPAAFYTGALFSYSNVELSYQKNVTASTKLWLLQAQLGYFFNDYLAIEARYGVGVNKKNNIKINYLGNVLIKGNIPITDRIALYVLIGGAKVKLNRQKIGQQTAQEVSFGLGCHYALDNKRALTLEYLNSINSNNTEVSGLQMSYQYLF